MYYNGNVNARIGLTPTMESVGHFRKMKELKTCLSTSLREQTPLLGKKSISTHRRLKDIIWIFKIL